MSKCITIALFFVGGAILREMALNGIDLVWWKSILDMLGCGIMFLSINMFNSKP